MAEAARAYEECGEIHLGDCSVSHRRDNSDSLMLYFCYSEKLKQLRTGEET